MTGQHWTILLASIGAAAGQLFKLEDWHHVTPAFVGSVLLAMVSVATTYAGIKSDPPEKK